MEMSFNEIKSKLKDVLTESRYEHVLRVNEMALRLNRELNLNLDEKKIQYAALLHDCAKNNEELYFEKYKDKYNLDYNQIFKIYSIAHAIIGPLVVMEEYNIYDENVLNAIRWHTTGRENMSTLEKLIFIADFIEIGRDFDGVEQIRNRVFENPNDLDGSLLYIMKNQLIYFVKKDTIFDIETLEARNYLIKNRVQIRRDNE